MKNIDNELKNFLKNINTKATLPKGLKYPYKPALVLAIFQTISVDRLFNKEISLNNFEIVKKYYEYISMNYEFWEELNKQESKKEWFLGIKNKIVQRLVLSNILNNPAKKLSTNNKVWLLDKKNRTIKINLPNENNYEYIKNLILDVAIKSLKDSNKDGYKNLDLSTSKCFQETIQQIIYSEGNTNNRNKVQHLFAKLVKDRDGKCLICCANLPQILDACHIKPFSLCKNDLEKIDSNNGITLCKNHHTLFDRGLFTLTKKWRIEVSDKNIAEDDINLFFKQYESCYSEIPKNLPFNNEYIQYRNKHIFLKG